MSIDKIALAIKAKEALDAPKKVVRISLRTDFYEQLTQSAADNGFFGVIATGPTSVEPALLGIPFVVRVQLQEFTLELE